jgi:hypothetical protein
MEVSAQFLIRVKKTKNLILTKAAAQLDMKIRAFQITSTLMGIMQGNLKIRMLT